MSLEGLQKFKSELFSQESLERSQVELAFIALVSLVSFVAIRVTNDYKISATECLVAGLSSFVLNHLTDAAALTIFKSYYSKKGILQGGLIAGVTTLSTLNSLHIFSKIAPGRVTDDSIKALTRIYVIGFPAIFNRM